MFDHDVLYQIVDSHFIKHLVRDDDTVQAEGNEPIPDAPENMLEDFLGELDEALEDLHKEFDYSPENLSAAVFGFVDGVLACSSGEYSSYEDSYFEDSNNSTFASVDGPISDYAEAFDGNRDWGEAAKGYVRHVIATGETVPETIDDLFWQARAQGFIYGADLCEDYEWKVIQTPEGDVLITDEEAIDEYSMRQLEASGGVGGIFGKMFDALGIDMGEFEKALDTIEKSDEESQTEAVDESGRADG